MSKMFLVLLVGLTATVCMAGVSAFGVLRGARGGQPERRSLREAGWFGPSEFHLHAAHATHSAALHRELEQKHGLKFISKDPHRVGAGTLNSFHEQLNDKRAEAAGSRQPAAQLVDAAGASKAAAGTKAASDLTGFLLDAWAIDTKIATDSSWAPCCAMLRNRPSLQAASDGFLDQGSGVLTAAAWQQLGCSKFRPSRFSVNNSPLCTAKRRTANCTAHLSRAPPQVGSAPQRVPRTIHQIWVGSSMPLVKQKLTGAAKKLARDNGWRYRLWGDADIAAGYFKLTGPLIAETKKGGEWASMADLMRVEIIYREGGVYVDTNLELLRDLTGVVEAAEARAAAASKAHVFVGCNEVQGLFTFAVGQYLSNSVFAASAKNPAVRLVIGRHARARVRQQRAAHAKANWATGPWHFGWSMVRAHNDTRIRSAVEFVILRAIAFFPFTAWNAVDPCGAKMNTFKHPDKCYYHRGRDLKGGQERLHDARSGKTLAFPCDRDVYPHSLGVDHWQLGGSWLRR